MLRNITVANLRSFRQASTLPLKPLTVLLGRNSSGKSTLTRLLPLLRQSLEKQTAAPILWASDIVDFGSVQEAITHDATSDEISITFEIDAASLSSTASRRGSSRNRSSRFPADRITYSTYIKSFEGRTAVSRIKLDIDGHAIELCWGDGPWIDHIIIDGKRLPPSYIDEIFSEKTSLFPDVVRVLTEEEIDNAEFDYQLYPPATKAFFYFIHGRTKSTTQDYLFRQLSYIPRRHLREYLSDLPYVIGRRLQDDAALGRLADALLVNDIPRLIKYVESELRPALQSSSYLGPARARGDRFYRIQELSVSDVDASGENLAMYLTALRPDELKDFNKILLGACGYVVSVENAGPGHVSIHIGRPEAAHFENIADVGFGFSQLLPVVAQIHAAINKGDYKFLSGTSVGSTSELIAIEQPELHLHPALQSNLGDLFASAVKEHAGKLRMVVETHSESMIARLGTLVAFGELDPSDVAILFVEKDDYTQTSRVRKTTFSKDGIVESWPAGFFSSDL